MHLRDEIRRLQAFLGITTVFVTHDVGVRPGAGDRVGLRFREAPVVTVAE